MIDIIVYIECGLLLTLIWVGFSGIRFEVGWEESPPPPTQTYVVSENIPFNTKVLLILLMSEFFGKKSAFLAIIVPLLKAIL